jgi:hypothetical protein
VTDDDYIPPPRSLLWANPVSTEQGPGIELGCDCGTSTILVIDGADQLTELREIAATCDGCNSTRWITVGPADQLEQEPGDGD